MRGRLAPEVEGYADSVARCATPVLGNLAFLSARPHDAEPLFESAWRRCDPHTDTCLAVRIAQRHALHWFLRLQAELAVQWSERGLAVGGRNGSPDETTVGEAHVVHAVALAHLPAATRRRTRRSRRRSPLPATSAWRSRASAGGCG